MEILGIFLILILIFIWKAVWQANRNLRAMNDRVELVALYVEKIWEESDLIERHISGRDENSPQKNSQSNLGLMYDNGHGVTLDNKEAAKLLKVAAEQGHANAQNKLGKMYANGQGVLRNYVPAHMWFYLAGVKGNKDATRNISIVEKVMSPKDISEAQKLARDWMEKHKNNNEEDHKAS